MGEEYDPEELAEFVTDMVKEIGEGVYDLHLRALVRACYLRRDKIKGTDTVIPDNGAYNVPHPSQVPAPDAKPRVAAAFISATNMVPKVPKFTRIPASEVQIRKGIRYRRADLLHRQFIYPNHFNPQALRGCTMEIIGVGDRSVKALIRSTPRSSRGQYYSKYMNDDPIFLNWITIDDWLEK